MQIRLGHRMYTSVTSTSPHTCVHLCYECDHRRLVYRGQHKDNDDREWYWDGIGNAAIRTEPVEFTYNYFIYGGGGIVELKFDTEE